MYKTCSIRAKFNDEETAFWLNQCEAANSLINCALYETKKIHYAKLQENGNTSATLGDATRSLLPRRGTLSTSAFTTYWRGDDLRSGWKTYRCSTTYPELDLILKQNVHYKAMAAQSAQQTLKSVGESITAFRPRSNIRLESPDFQSG